MFEAVRNNKRIVQVILGVITLSFAFFGIESYLRGSGKSDEVALVGGVPISRAEFDRAQREQQERIRASNSGQVDEALFRTKEFRQATLDNLINQRALAQQAVKVKLSVNDRQLQTTIVNIPGFQNAGQFDAKLYQSVLESQGMSRPGFEARLRQELAVQQIVSSIAEGAMAPLKDAEWLLQSQLEQRDIRIREFYPSSYLSKVSVADDAIRAYYDKNPGLFERPARLRAEYLVLDDRQIEKSIKVSDDEVRKWYEGHSDKFTTPEERRASHILITLPASAQEGDVAKAKATAEELLVKLRADPSSFGVIAGKFSQDPGSAQKEGDLGYFGRGIMVKPFEDATFQIKSVGELIGPVRSDFGFHIIKLTGVKPAKIRPFEEVASEVRDELRKQGLSKRFAEAAESFSNTVYEQADSLSPVAERFQLKLQQTDWIQKDSETFGEYKSKKLVNALFSDDAIKQHRNTEAIDVGGGALVSGRVIAHEPAHRLTLEEAREQIVELLKRQEASKFAMAEGEKILAALKAGQALPEAWSNSQSINRRAGLPGGLVRAAFAIPGDKLPGYAGFEAQNGNYVVVMLEKVTSEAIKPDDARLKAVRAQYQQLLGRTEFSGYLSQVKDRLGVKVAPGVLRESAE